MPHIDIVFDGPPGPEAGRFVEVEDANGRGLKFGEWVHRGDGYWVLRISDHREVNSALLAALKESVRLWDKYHQKLSWRYHLEIEAEELGPMQKVRSAIAKAEGIAE